MLSAVFIMAGGSGTRLAPLSLTTPGNLPKQFLSLVGQDTLLQKAITRIPEKTAITIVPELKYEKEVLKQAQDINITVTSLSEPFGCNTAPAILLSAYYALNNGANEDTVLFFMPADHLMNDDTFRETFEKAITIAERSEKIVTIGIKPERPETGYGYILTDKDKNKDLRIENELPVLQFVEKPDLATAEKYVKSGDYYWNAGIFAFKVKTILQAMENDAPEIFSVLSEIKDNLTIDNISRQYTKIKEAEANISIDYAVMEKEASNMLLIPADTSLEWNDVGNWVSLEKYLNKDEHDNHFSDHIDFIDSGHNTVLNYLDISITLNHCTSILVVATKNGILICPKELAQRAKEIIPGIEAGKKEEMTDCEHVLIKNSTETYIGIIGLANAAVEYDNKKLLITG